MNVRQIQQLAATRTDAQAAHARPEAQPKAAGAPAPADRVEISAEARARASVDHPAESAELQRARKALLDIPPLDPQRVADVLDRVESGYYDRPEVVRMVAEALTAGFRAMRAEE